MSVTAPAGRAALRDAFGVRSERRAGVSLFLAGLFFLFFFLVPPRLQAGFVAADLLVEDVREVRLDQHVLFGDDPVAPELEQVVVEQLHAELVAGLDRRVDSERLVFTNQVRDRRGDDEHFVRRNTPALNPGEELLGEDPQNGGRKLGPDLVLLVRGEDVDDTVDRPLRSRAVIAASIVSKSRISPTRMTSGS